MIDAATCRFCIDEPKPFFASQGGIQFSGWCFDESSTAAPRVRLTVGDRTYHCETGLVPDLTWGRLFHHFPKLRPLASVYRIGCRWVINRPIWR